VVGQVVVDPARCDRPRPGEGERRERVRVVERGDLGHHATDADARQVRRPVVEFVGQCCGVGGKITQRVRGCLGIDDGRCAAVAQVVPHDVTSAARERLAERVGPGEHGRAAREQDQRPPGLAEVLDAERNAVGLDRRHEAGPGAMVPSGVQGGRTVECIVDLEDCVIASIDRPNASNSSLVPHDRSSAAARRADSSMAATPTDPPAGFGLTVRPAQQRPGRACRQSRRRVGGEYGQRVHGAQCDRVGVGRGHERHDRVSDNRHVEPVVA
jgi:hypothetical protein